MECFVERAGHNQQTNETTALDPPTLRGPPAPSAHLRSAPKTPPWSIPGCSLQEKPRAGQSQGEARLYLQLLHGQLLAVLLPTLYQDVQGISVVLALRVLQLLLDGFFQPLLQRFPGPDSLWGTKCSDHPSSRTLPVPGAPDVLRTGPSHKNGLKEGCEDAGGDHRVINTKV